MKKRVRYYHTNIALSKLMHEEIEKESFKLGISKQTFMRSLVTDYFWRIHGRDIILESNKLKYSDDRDYPKTDERN